MKNLCILVLMSLLISGCVTNKPQEEQPLPTITPEKAVEIYKESEGSDGTNIAAEVTEGTFVFLDPDVHDIKWMVMFADSNGGREQWITTFVGFSEDGGIWFIDSEFNIIKLKSQYSYMLIKLNEWTHYGWQSRKEIVPHKKPEEPEEQKRRSRWKILL